ncbi:MAG: hypothetical protein UV05_C0011G0021 [candidate division CPR1 bacterium GW2011_GWA2_42_17]|uniref:Uncharacterized protein n=1 Tax=candidate division CPR1 bacterium GW2011_GWA2_42_17 TaxID=1618341 RepID=A0A0G0Z629_9BACT|nr:MAG: hypothetical protein UV05_C0011G0021 [candidate division CPR1 bacterium GW2011_GWA2_42_17]
MPSNSIKSEQERINLNAQILGDHYETLMPGRGLREAFSHTLCEVAEAFEKGAVGGDQRLFQSALSELRLLTEVDRLLAQGDKEHLESLHGNRVGPTFSLQTTLSGLQFKEGVAATFAEWLFEPTGIRLEVTYYDPETQKEKTIKASMDFHYRGKGENLSKAKQAALDLKGNYITPALHKAGGMDYHRSERFTGVISSDEDFARLREARLQKVKELLV